MRVKNIRYLMLAADLLWVLGALAIGISLRYVRQEDLNDFAQHFQDYSFAIVAAIVAWTFLYFEMSLDGFKGGWHFPTIVSKLFVAVSLLMVVLLAAAFVTQHFYSRLVLFYFALAYLPGLVGGRCLVRFLVTSELRNVADRRCVILGHGPVARELASKIASHPEIPFQVVGFLFPGDPEISNGFASSLEGPFTSVKTLQVLELLVQQKIMKLIIAMPQPDSPEVRKLIAGCRRASIQVYLVPHWYDLYVSKAELVEIDGLPLLSIQEPNRPAALFDIKRAVDFVLSLGILLFASPILVLAALVVYSKKGKAFRGESRCGRDGAPFDMYRLNIDRHAANPERYERLFVRWSLTELPQMWNVLRGDMSLVGPRPEPAERVKYYSDWQRQRLKVRAGVTGLAQVHGLREQHSSEEKARFDLQYMFNWSPFLDLSLIVQTVWTVLIRGLRQEPVVPQATSFRSQTNNVVAEELVDANRS
jgi:lipopolysaccharide/colanic/teichoic acid biosynthesis glycosyltransferase